MLFTKFVRLLMGQSEYFVLNSSVSCLPASSALTPCHLSSANRPRLDAQFVASETTCGGSARPFQTKADGPGFRPPQEMKIRHFNAVAVSSSYAYFRKKTQRFI